MVLAWAFGVLAAATVLQAAVTVVAINLSLYAAIRSGFNLRFDDPSLTRLQMIAAITVVMFIAYHLHDGRNIVIFGCFIVFLFGVFRLSAREFVVVVLYSLAAYALVIDLLMYLRPQYIRSVFDDWMSWLLFAAFLPWFAVIGGNINTLRRRLHDSEVRFRSLTDLSSDFYWESDTEHRLTLLSAGGGARGLPPLRRGPAARRTPLGNTLSVTGCGGLEGAPGAAGCASPAARLRIFASGRRRQRALPFDQRESGVRCVRRVHGLPRRRQRRH